MCKTCFQEKGYAIELLEHRIKELEEHRTRLQKSNTTLTIENRELKAALEEYMRHVAG